MTASTDHEGTPPSAPRPPVRGPRLPEAPETSSALDRAMLLAEVMDYVVKVSKPTPLVLPRPRVWIPLTTFFCCCFALYSYAARPAWIWGPQPDPNAFLATHDADMRFAMFLLAQRIFEYRREFGRVPATLADVGDRVDSVRYVPLTDSTFSLRYESSQPIIYYSTEPTSELLRNALDIVTAGASR